uniref:Ion transport domain-containing protein n=1 Tax=Naja naja TaxID=35670 RepID=A0A8C6XGI3_NAJNA
MQVTVASFFAFLTKIWWGDMSTSTPILNLICGFGCPFLIYTNLISFSPITIINLKLILTPPPKEVSPAWPVQTARFSNQPASGNIAYATFMFTRWKKFWTAPITVFMGNVVMYFAFLFLFAYVLLVDFKPPPKGPATKENILYFWVFTLVLEEIRQVGDLLSVNLQSFFTDGGMNLIKKFKLYVEDNWNKCDMLAISLFITGITCRMFNSTFHDGRTVLAIDFMVFTLRLIHIFAIHKQLGPKIIIVERMMKDVFFFLFFLSVWLIAYGVATQALLYPDDSRAEWIFRRVLYRPYLQIFGQIPLDKIDSSRMDFENCTLGQQRNQTASDFSCPSSYANWLVIILLVIFLLVTNVLLMNLLIAMFRQDWSASSAPISMEFGCPRFVTKRIADRIRTLLSPFKMKTYSNIIQQIRRASVVQWLECSTASLLLQPAAYMFGSSKPARLKVDSAFRPSEVGKMRTQIVGGNMLIL